MGAVYRARQHSIGREVAVKVLSPDLISDAMSIKRFLREAKLASRLAHPNVVAVLDFGQTADGVFYLVMELVAGETLEATLAREGQLELPRWMRIAIQLCDALDGAHALPIVHRDLKPANIMVLAHGRDLVKVLDFGLAKSLLPDAANATMASAGTVVGTPMFLPPEVANGLGTDSRADLYSLGCILYLMGSGRPPFITDSIPAMIAMHGHAPAPPMSGVPIPIASVVHCLLEKDPDRRYQTAAEVRSALEAAHDSVRTYQPFAIGGLPWGDAATTHPHYVRPQANAAEAPRRWRPPIRIWVVALVVGVACAVAIAVASSMA
jgi:serine/threonine-protein kinase